MYVVIQLYEAFILPHLEYCAPVLIGITKSLSNKLEDANYYILRTLLGLPKSTTYDSVLILINTRTLEQRKVFSSFDPTRTVNYNLRGSGTKLEQSSFYNKWRLNSFASTFGILYLAML